MPLIKPRTVRTKLVRHITQLFAENQEDLYAYATFIGESSAYVLNELIDTLRKDSDYKAWRADHQASFVPVVGQVKRRSTPSSRARTSAGRANIAALPPPA
jgi:predicted ferric reductase